MIKAVIRTALVAALAVGVLGFTATVRAEEKKEAKGEHKKPDMFHGEIEAVDTKAGTVTIKGHKESKTFIVNADTDLAGLGKDIKIADLKVGDKVSVHVKPDTTPFVATKIGHIDAPKAKAKKDDAK